MSGGSGNFPTLDQSRSYGNLTINSGATLTLGSNTLSLTGNIVNNGTLTATGSTVNLTGSTTQDISGSSATAFNNLTVNNTGAGITLSQDASVGGFLNLTDGIVTSSSANTLSVTSTGGTSGGSDASHVSGPMQKVGSGDFLFPVGKNGIWAPIEITGLSASDTFTAEYFVGEPSNITVDGGGLAHVSEIEYWNLTRTGSATANVALHWKSDTRSEITTPSDLVVALFNTSSMAWNSLGQSAVSGTTTGFVRAANVSSFGDITFGSAAGNNPLPITLLYFRTEARPNGILLSWATASEENNSFFTIERGLSLSEMQPIAIMAGAGNSQSRIEYEYLDEPDQDGPFYYRLKQTDFNGNFSYSEILLSEFTKQEQHLGLKLMPNPNLGEVNLEISGLGASDYRLTIIDPLGKAVFNKAYQKNGGTTIEMNHSLSPGVYLVLLQSDGRRLTQRMVVK